MCFSVSLTDPSFGLPVNSWGQRALSCGETHGRGIVARKTLCPLTEFLLSGFIPGESPVCPGPIEPLSLQFRKKAGPSIQGLRAPPWQHCIYRTALSRTPPGHGCPGTLLPDPLLGRPHHGQGSPGCVTFPGVSLKGQRGDSVHPLALSQPSKRLPTPRRVVCLRGQCLAGVKQSMGWEISAGGGRISLHVSCLE